MSFTICRPAIPREHINLIFKITGSTCNLDCGYCFEKRREYPVHSTIDERTVVDVLALLSDNEISVELHGGEPTLIGISRMKAILEAIVRAKPGSRVRLQTNATLLDTDWCKLFLQYPSLSIGVSLDGFASGNDFRYDNLGRDSTAATLKGISQLENNQIDYGLICVCSSANKNRYRDYLDSAATLRHVKTVRFLPCFDKGTLLSSTVPRSDRTKSAFRMWSASLPWEISFPEFSEIVKASFQHWRDNHYYERFLLDPATDYLKKLLTGTCSTCHFQAKKCFHTMTVFPDRTFSLCDEIDHGARFPLTDANNSNTVLDLLEGRLAIEDPLTEPLRQQCRQCEVKEICSGGCPAIRRRYFDIDKSEGYCGMQKDLIRFFQLYR